MPLSKEQKNKIIEELKEKVSRQKASVFVDLAGLKVKDISNLRKRFKAVGSELKVAKKTLMNFVFKTVNLPIETKKLPGEIAIGFGYQDEISAAKTLWQFSQENPNLNLKILGGILENQFVPTERVIELAKLPTKEQLLGRLVGSISSPMSGMLNVLQGNIRNFVSVLSRIKSES
jgi:large subunit ribosomal protein L10